jgi:N-acetylneuraminic acid mutarotase
MSAKAQPRFFWSQLPDLPDAFGLGGPFAGVSGGHFLVAGGTNFPDAPLWKGGKKIWHDAVYLLPSVSSHWRKAGTLPRRIAYGVSVSTDRGLVCIGGTDAHRHYADVCLLKVSREMLSARSLPPLSTPMAYGCGALLDGVLYVAGGMEAPDSTAAMRRFWALDLHASPLQWRELDPWPGPARMLAVAAVQNGAFFLISGVALVADHVGRSIRSYLRDAYRFSPAAGWSPIADVPKPVVAAPSPAAPFARSKILVLGADDGSTAGFQPLQAHPGFSKEMFIYDTQANSWTHTNGAPISCAAVPMVEWNQRFVIPSGELRPGVRSPQVWAVALEC